MGSEQNGTQPRPAPEECLNVFALVIYIPGPLGRFLDDLRREVVPDSNPHAHVSVLPPRPLAVSWQTASEQARALTDSWSPFDIQLTSIQVFPVTHVIYLEVGAGASELRRMHAAMNGTSLAFQEPFPYHPHVTVAQEIPHSGVEAVHEIAQRRWREYKGERTFCAKHAVFVQGTIDNQWIDLAEYSFGAVAVR
jgi:2'-5' RNA ligase